MIEVFAMVLCTTYTNPNWDGRCALIHSYSTAEACKSQVARMPSPQFLPHDAANGERNEYRCVSKSTPEWKPVE